MDCICGEMFRYEPHHDNADTKQLYHNNIVVCGNYMKDYHLPPSHARVKLLDDFTQEYNYLVNTLTIYYIDKPTKKLKK